MPKSLPDAFEPPKPELVEAEGQASVDPLKLLEGATVRVCYEGMLSTDLIALSWQTAPGEYAPIEPQYGVDAGCIEFKILPFFVGLLLDSFAVFFYTVHRDGEDYESLRARVRISRPSNLAALTFMGASDGDVDLSLSCCRDPIVWGAPWPFIDRIQTVRLHVIGTYKDGTGFSEWYFDGENLTEQDVANGWSRTLPFATLSQLKHRSKLVLVFFVAFHGTDSGHSIMFPNSMFTLLTDPHLDLAPPKLREAVKTEFGDWVVNPTNTVDGAHIEMAYEGICSKDLVCPTFSGTPGDGSPPLECRTVGEGANSVVVPVPPSAISANFEKNIKLSYKVTRCDGSQWSAPEQTVKVLGITGLPKPYIEQVTGRVLDLSTFNDDATVVVPIWDYAAVGQCLWVWITGALEDGSAYQFFILMDEPLTPDWLTNGVDAPITRAELQKLEDCSDFELHAAVSFDGKCDLATAFEFPVQTFNIDQEDLVLDAPDVLEAVGKQLTIYNARNGMTVRVAYPRMSDKHQIQLNVKRPDGTYIPSLPLPGDRNRGYVDFSIDRTEVIHASGKTLTINYTVSSACKLQTSEDLGLEVSVPVRLTTPEVAQATPPATQGGILDLRTFVGEAHISVDPWWFILTEQLYWLTCEGTKEDGSPYTITVSTREPIKNGDLSGLLRSLDRDELEKLRDKTQLKIQLKVTADGSNRVEDAIVFPELTLTLRKFYKNVTDFADWTLQGWSIGPGAPDPRDIAIERITGPDGLPGNALRNFTYAFSGNVGWVLQKRFNDLEVGYSYRFSVSVRSWSAHPVTPKLSLRKDSVRETPIQAIEGVGWYNLNFKFVANSQSVVLDIYNSEDLGGGNDWYMMYFTVEGV